MRISQPVSVTSKVCSNCAERLPSYNEEKLNYGFVFGTTIECFVIELTAVVTLTNQN